jgi:ADP-ribose pyrophosphatase
MKNDPKKWKTLNSRTLLDHKQLQIAEDEVLLPSGAQTTYLKHATSPVDSVIIIALNRKNQILLQREYSYPPNEVMWQLPGGSMLLNEKIETAANRELAEESGYHAQKLKNLGFFYVNNRLSDKKQHIVLGTDLIEHYLEPDVDEFITTHWYSVPTVKKMIGSGEIININLLAALNKWFNTYK